MYHFHHSLLSADRTLDLRLVAGGQVSKIDPSRAGLNPAWREAGAHVVVASLWPDGATTAEIQGRKDMIRERSKDLRALAPESGAYFNEASLITAGL